MTVHHLALTDRGPVHVHRWVASCSCGGWSAIPLRLKRSAIREFRRHRNRVTRLCIPGPRPCTPEWELPEALRVGA